MPESPWGTPKEALAYALEHFPDDAVDLSVRAWTDNGRVYCETTQTLPALKFPHADQP